MSDANATRDANRRRLEEDVKRFQERGGRVERVYGSTRLWPGGEDKDNSYLFRGGKRNA